MVELLRVAQSSPQSLAVLDVAGVVAYAGVEDVLQTMFAKEQVADDAHRAAIGGVCPKFA